MGISTRLYGCIVEYGLQTGELQAKIYAHNQTVISQLPENDSWPPLAKKMFAITDNSAYPAIGPDYGYGGRIIHFGVNLKNFSIEWGEWKLKFEDLLTRLLWTDADVHFQTEYCALQTFCWRIDLKNGRSMTKQS